MNQYKELSTALRFLSADAVEKACSGHPGMPLGMADIATILWKKHLNYNPTNPHWFNRDRFILSNGHGSMLQYALLHLTGYNLSIEDIKQFRQLHSKTPGHPEWNETPGVEATTGPLGQGLANAVGMAIAEKMLATHFNKPNLNIVDHYTYVFAGDGCLMEGISHEACSLAGTFGLGKLIMFYDDNGISIDGKVDAWFTDDTSKRFQAYHWQVIGPIDGHDYQAIEEAIIQAKQERTKPSIIICKTTIGYGSLQAGTERVHGAPLGQADIARMRQNFNWPHAEFVIPTDIYAKWNQQEQGQQNEQTWIDLCEEYKTQYPDIYVEFLRRINGDLPDSWPTFAKQFLENCLQNNRDMATRKTSQVCIENYAQILPELLGGSADLTASNNTNWSKSHAITHDDFSGNYIYYGVRELGMSAIMNGIALHGGFIPYGGTFLAFTDYARSAVRLSALMKQRVIYVYSHDSIGLGEDGPTHQPIEHAAMLRMTPNLHVWRPATLLETAVAWKQSIEYLGPSCLLLSRQNLPIIPHTPQDINLIQRGGYIIKNTNDNPDAILIATGSELALACQAAEILEEDHIYIRVVSMPCAELFLAQDIAYQQSILPPSIRTRVAIEAGTSMYWYRFVGLDGAIIGIDSFGASAPGPHVYQAKGITLEHTLHVLQKLLNSEQAL